MWRARCITGLLLASVQASQKGLSYDSAFAFGRRPRYPYSRFPTRCPTREQVMAVPQSALSSGRSLEAIRHEIDALDDSMLELLIKRAALVAEVAAVKAQEGGNGGPLFRPGREAAIMRRLLGRNLAPLPADVAVRVWREIISSLTRLQGPFGVAASTPKCVELARDHFGSASLQSASSVASIVTAVAKERSQLGVLPLPAPSPRGDAAWWRSIPPGIQIVAKLPFLVRGPIREGNGALVIGRQEF